ncbi:MAG TPA: metallophosphoesterase family protein, partial [Candidatus Acidoferrum sp.]|nr:metallophosphoesterase family protein [Candidatus Acidoferrum sp.]
MRVFIFSDIHGDLRALNRIVEQPADLYIAAGDLATFGKGLDRCGEVLRPLGSRLWVLPGNHETHEDTRALCARFGFIDFHRQIRSVEGGTGRVVWAGLGY